MNATTRRTEIMKAMPSFSKELYHKSELLPELFLLQNELVNLTFNGEHAENAQLKIWDVFNHLAKINEDREHVADELLQKFHEGCKIVNESIRGEITGNNGERKALRSIETVRSKHMVLQNIELDSGDHRTELDIIVFTGKAVFIVEVKNPTKDIIIDENGNYCRNSNGYISFDKNIGEKMNDKVFLLRSALQDAGIEDPNIISLVVFTNYNIKVTNNFPFIKHCFLSSLPHLIDGYEGETIYTEDMIAYMVNSVNKAKYTGCYSLPLDINQFKRTFADLMVALEGLPEEEPVAETEQIVAINAIPLWMKRVGSALTIIPIVGLAAATLIGIGKSIN